MTSFCEVNGIPKTANGGFSAFYSKDLNPQQVVDAINEACNNCKIISAFPEE